MAILVSAVRERVEKNATEITDAGGLSDSVLAASFDDDSMAVNGEYMIVEGETIGIGSVGSSPRTISRGENDEGGGATTPTVHDEGVFARKQGGGHKLLEYDFGATPADLAGFKLRSERAFWWALFIDDVLSDEGYCDSKEPFYTDVQPLASLTSGVYKIYVWWQAPSSTGRTGQVFWGKMFN